MTMEMIVDITMTRLFLLAEFVLGKFSFLVDEPTYPKAKAPTICFSNEDRMVEGELFKSV